MSTCLPLFFELFHCCVPPPTHLATHPTHPPSPTHRPTPPQPTKALMGMCSCWGLHMQWASHNTPETTLYTNENMSGDHKNKMHQNTNIVIIFSDVPRSKTTSAIVKSP